MNLGSILKYSIGILLGVVLMWLAFKDMNWNQLFQNLSNANYGWVVISLSVSLTSHYLRAWRWTLLLKAAGYEVKKKHAFAALMVGYMANMAVPRMGEVSRCTMLNKPSNVPFATAGGTVVTERALDVIMLGMFILLALFLEFDKISLYFATAQGANNEPSNKLYILGTLALLIGLAIVGFYILRDKIEKLVFYQKIKNFVVEIVRSALSVRRMESQGLFWFITLLIWICYLLVSYLCFFALESTSHLTIYFGLICMIMGGIGMTMPVPGGLGPFHNAIIFSFVAWGYPRSDGELMALLIHTPQLVMLVVSGAIGYYYLMFEIQKDLAKIQKNTL